MASLVSYDYECPVCLRRENLIVERGSEDKQFCEVCSDAPVGDLVQLTRLVSAPAVVGKAAYLDGTKRFDKLRAQDTLDRALSESQTFDDRRKILIEKDKVQEKKS